MIIETFLVSFVFWSNSLLFHYISENILQQPTKLQMLQKQNLFTQPPSNKEVTFETANVGTRAGTNHTVLVLPLHLFASLYYE